MTHYVPLSCDCNGDFVGLPLGPGYPGLLPSFWAVMSSPHLDEILLHYQRWGAAGHVGNEKLRRKKTEIERKDCILLRPNRKKSVDDDGFMWHFCTLTYAMYIYGVVAWVYDVTRVMFSKILDENETDRRLSLTSLWLCWTCSTSTFSHCE